MTAPNPLGLGHGELLVSAFVAGRPATKGSLAARPNGTVYESVRGSTRWRALVASAVGRAYRANYPNRGPSALLARVDLTFWLPVPSEALGRRGSGDIDKLERNVLDALTGAVLVDDAQVVALSSVKLSAPACGMPQGALIVVRVVGA